MYLWSQLFHLFILLSLFNRYLKSTFHHTTAMEDCGHTFIRASSFKSQCLVFWSEGVLLLPNYNPTSNIVLIFAFICDMEFYRFIQSAVLEVTCRELKETPNMEIIYDSSILLSLSARETHESALSTRAIPMQNQKLEPETLRRTWVLIPC